MLNELLRASFWEVQLATPPAELLVKITLLLVVALVMSILLRGAAAGVRHLLWATTIAALLALPFLSAVSPVRVQMLPVALSAAPPAHGSAAHLEHFEPRGHGETAGVVRAHEGVAPAAPPVTRDHDAVAPAPPARTASALSIASLATLIVAVWGAVAIVLMGRLVIGWLIVRRIARSGEELTTPDWTTPLWEAADRLDLADVPRLIRSERAALPFACGVRRPMIVLPPESEEWSEERRRAVLFHELAHVRRRDLLAHTLGRVACALYWPHPLVWSAARRLRSESERACDDLVLATGTRASEYADHLLQIVTAARHSRAPSVALPMAQRREFEGRMLAILDPRGRRRLPRFQSAAVAAMVVLVAGAIAAAAPATGTAAADVPMLAAEYLPDPADTLKEESRRYGDVPTIADAPELSASPSHDLDRSIPDEAGVASPADASAQAHAAARAGHGEGIADFARDVAQIATDATIDALRDIATSVNKRPQPAQPQDSAAAARETALLISVLGSNRDATVRRTAAWGLHRRGGSTAADALRAALLGDASAEVRETAAWALANRRDLRHVDALATAATRDTDTAVRGTAAWALGHLRARQHTDALVPALSHEDPETRMTAAWAMGQMRPSGAPARLIALVNDPSTSVRETAAWALGEIRDPAAVPVLLDALDRESGKGARSAMVRAVVLSASGDSRALEMLALSPHADLQERAIRAIARGGADSWPWPWPWPRPRPSP